MATRTMIDEFMAQKKLVLVRASRKARISGFSIDKELGTKGHSVAVVYLDEAGPGAWQKELAGPVGGAIIAVPADLAEQAVQQLIEAKIPRVWIQQGSETKSAIQLCEKNGVPVIHGECVMMFAEPIKSFHSFHRWIWKLLGKLPA